MPRYDYKCKKCGAHEIISHGFHDEGEHSCFDETCDGLMGRVISPTPVIFRGSGFYKTDNR
jgi:putative FmdB family regulatory protein